MGAHDGSQLANVGREDGMERRNTVCEWERAPQHCQRVQPGSTMDVYRGAADFDCAPAHEEVTDGHINRCAGSSRQVSVG
jgi:hypothetical protein